MEAFVLYGVNTDDQILSGGNDKIEGTEIKEWKKKKKRMLLGKLEERYGSWIKPLLLVMAGVYVKPLSLVMAGVYVHGMSLLILDHLLPLHMDDFTSA